LIDLYILNLFGGINMGLIIGRAAFLAQAFEAIGKINQ